MPQASLLRRIAAALRGGAPEPAALTTAEAAASSARGTARAMPLLGTAAQLQALDIFSLNDNYFAQVEDCVRLSEHNLIFSGIINKLARTVAQPLTRLELPPVNISARRSRKILGLFDDFVERIGWEHHKEFLIRNLLNEGGLSWEVVVAETAAAAPAVRALEYRPHFTIRPLLDGKGRFFSADKAYRQVDRTGREQGTFARWQLIDLNLVDSAYHNRGIPHLAAARDLLHKVGLMLRGATQKWVRAGGAIEHFNLADASKWTDVDNFKKTNVQALEAAPDSMIRQFFTKGKATIERLGGDKSGASDVAIIEFYLELIFFAAGCPKAALGFSSNQIVKELSNLIWQNFNQTLDFIERKLFHGLDQAFQMELLLHAELPEALDYRLIGGEFEPTSAIKVDKTISDAGALSLNEMRRAAGAEPDPDPLFDIPGFRLTQDMAERIASERGVAPPWLVEQVELKAQNKKDMAALASKAALAAAAGNPDPTRATGLRPPSTPKNGKPPRAQNTRPPSETIPPTRPSRPPPAA
jgi:hypothetical protein